MATSRRLTASEQAAVEGWLTPETAGIFFSQDDPDQRHGYHSALSVIASGVKDHDVVMAALLHDVGKRHARLGLVGRSVASVLILTGLPLPERARIYRDHGIMAARELAPLGVPSLVIDFALHHHGTRPSTVPSNVWNVLVAADQAPKPWSGLSSRITSTAK